MEIDDVSERDISLFVEQEKTEDVEPQNRVHYSRTSIVQKKYKEEPFRIDDEELDRQMEKASIPNYKLRVVPKNKPISVVDTSSQSSQPQTVPQDREQSQSSSGKKTERKSNRVVPREPEPKKQETRSAIRHFRSNKVEMEGPKKLTEKQRLKQIAFLRRRNYTAQFARGSEEFRKQARTNILNSPTRGVCENGLCRQFTSGKEVPFNYSTTCSSFRSSSPTGTFHPENVDVTMIATATFLQRPSLMPRLNRLPFVADLQKQWNGYRMGGSMRSRPMCITVWAHEEEVKDIEPFATSLTASGGTVMILYQVKPDHPNYYDFPVNLLRNICIRHITTSHFMVLDIDMWPTETMHKNLVSILPSVLADETHAIVVPPIFLSSRRMAMRCFKLAKCFELCE